jgi:hypothetical protein
MSSSVSGQSSADLMAIADRAYEAGEREKAKGLYERAALLHNGEAHFALAYKYVDPPGGGLYHYMEAAKSGHSEATEHAIEILFLRSNSLTLSNPELAMDVYMQAKKANPRLQFSDEEGTVELLSQAIEAGPFDVQAFIRKYHITGKDTADEYGIWEMASEAYKGKRFGKPDLKMIFQLVVRGSSVPAEKRAAIADAYRSWKDGKAMEFDPCEYVTSRIGYNYCAYRSSDEAEKEYLSAISKLEKELKNGAGPLLRPAYMMAGQFFDEKGFKEEGHDGTMYSVFARESIDAQKGAFLSLVKKVNNGFRPKLVAGRDYDKELNLVYRELINGLKREAISTGFNEVSADGVRGVQLKWIKYRDGAARLFGVISGSVGEEEWKRYLTSVRIGELRGIGKLREE